MADNSCMDVLQHPEVLDREDLLQILQKRCIPLQEIDNLDKEQLVFLFYKYVSPLPQRIHQLRRAKREPPKSSKNVTISSSFVLQNTSRKRISDINNQASKVKIPKSDLEHVLINNGPSKIKPGQMNHNTHNPSNSEASCSSKSKATSDVKSRPVKLNRKSLNLELNSNKPTVDRKISHNGGQECSDNQFQSNTNDSLEASQESSDSSLDDISVTKKKFKKIAISWP